MCLRQSKKEAAQRGIGLALSSISPNSSASSLFLSLCHLFSRFLWGWCKCLRQSIIEAAQRGISLALRSISPNSSASSLFLSLSLSLPSLSLSLPTFFFPLLLRGWCKCLRQSNIEAAQRDTSLALSSISPNSSASPLFLSLSLSLSLSISLFLLYTLFFPAFFGVGACV